MYVYQFCMSVCLSVCGKSLTDAQDIKISTDFEDGSGPMY